MSNYRKGWLAIVCAYRREEDDLQATLESAAKSAGPGAVIYAVEDKDRSGPGRNRHRGIEAAKDAEAVVLIDAHMRFQGDVLRRMGKHVRADGGLLVPFCHNNERCDFDDKPYSGARMVWGSRDDDISQTCALVAKWSSDTKPGPRSAVMGACYGFRRDWYYRVGQPLSMLTGWGCDEELLSIAAWMDGSMPELIDAHVAHRFRKSPPWGATAGDHNAATDNRRRMIIAVVPDEADRHALFEWQGKQGASETPELVRLRSALLSLPRKWADWKRDVCQPAEVNGKPVSAGYHQVQAIRQPVQVPRQHVQNIIVPLQGVICPHCRNAHDPYKLKVTHKFQNGNRRHICHNCAKPFISRANMIATS